MGERSRGTAWRKWDLHVHTPSSIVQHYGPNDPETWERFIRELEGLPEDIRVIGINDYWFLDGYRQVLDAKADGRLPNIDEIFPVVELRLEHLSGVRGAWQRVNLHVVFDPEIGPDVIEQQFLSALTHSFDLHPDAPGGSWSGVVTRDSLIDLGKAIKASVPASELKHYGTDLEEGFNNLVIPLDSVKRPLGSTYLRGKALVGVGRAEWANIQWFDGSIASKKSVINFADFVFTASQDVSTWSGIVTKLKDSKVTHKLLDCSDAHHWPDSDQNERLGQCATWINASPSFAGLCHALSEFEDRVHVGLEPPVRARMRTHPEHFIDRVTIGSNDPSNYDVFDYELPINPGFVAVIGNKGQGKSALLDCMALAGNSARTSEFAFLNPRRFLSATNKDARQYFSELQWADGTRRRRSLTDPFEASAPVQVEYLPQAFVERLCTAVPRSVGDDEFEAELRAILFTHIPQNERAGASSFDELLGRRTRSSLDRIESYRRELAHLIDDYLALARFRAEHTVADLEGQIGVRAHELESAKAALDQATSKLQELEERGSDDPELGRLTSEASRLTGIQEEQIEEVARLQTAAGKLNKNLLDLESLRQRIENLVAAASDLDFEADLLLASAVVDGEDNHGAIVSVSVNREAIASWEARVRIELRAIEEATRAAGEKLSDANAALEANNARLATHDSARELARQAVLQSKMRVEGLIGDESKSESLRGLEAIKRRAEAAPADMEAKKERLLAKAEEVHAALKAQLASVSSLYAAAASFIADSNAISQAELEFKAELRLVPTLNGLGSQLDGRKNPNLGGEITSLPDRVGAGEWGEVAAELSAIIDALSHERGDVDGRFRDPASALRSGVTASSFLLALLDLQWIEVRFGLTGGGVPLSQLSPGQRGLVLALFYLVVDRRETPLLLDQPEENLDNETISSLLVPALREAAGRRQTIVVTHNANLAVVGDADQIVHCAVVDGRFVVEAGSIADFATAQHAVNVLEGTMPSFVKRGATWEVHPALTP